VKFVGTHEIVPTDRGSRVTLGTRFGGPLGPMLGRLTSGLTRRYVQMEAEGLKRRSEAAT